MSSTKEEARSLAGVSSFEDISYDLATDILVHSNESVNPVLNCAYEIAPIISDAVMTGDIITILMGISGPSNIKPRAVSKYVDVNGVISSRDCAYFLAIQVQARSAAEFRFVWKVASFSPNTALCAARFPGFPVYDCAAILGSKEGLSIELFKAIGFMIAPDKVIDNLIPAGRAKGKVPNTSILATSRTKKNTLPINWFFDDYDPTEFTPEYFRSLNTIDRLAILDKHLPGIKDALRVSTLSASSRVLKDGKPIGGARGHNWIYCKSTDWEARSLAVQRARASMVCAGDMWTVEAVNGAKLQRFLTDFSTWTDPRLAYVGKPEVHPDAGFEVLS